MYKIFIATDAEMEIIQAKKWYEKKRQGLGDNFTSTIQESIESLKTDMVEHRLVFGEVRRLMVKRFPYLIYYKCDSVSMSVKILAVLHHRQDQQMIRDRQ